MTPRRAVKCAGARVPVDADDHSRAAAGWPSALAGQAVGYATWQQGRNRLKVTGTGTLTHTAQALRGLQATAADQTVTRKQRCHDVA